MRLKLNTGCGWSLDLAHDSANAGWWEREGWSAGEGGGGGGARPGSSRGHLLFVVPSLSGKPLSSPARSPGSQWSLGQRCCVGPCAQGGTALRAAANRSAPGPCFLPAPSHGALCMDVKARRDLCAGGQDQSLPLGKPTHLLPPRGPQFPHLPRSLGSRWMTWDLEVEELLWGLRRAVLGPHWGPPAQASPAASPSASTVRPGSWLGVRREPQVWELGAEPAVHPLPSPGLPVTLRRGRLSSFEVPSSHSCGQGPAVSRAGPGQLGLQESVPGRGGNTQALALGPGWAWESCAAWKVRKVAPGLWEERLRDEPRWGPRPCGGQRAEPQSPGSLGQERGAQRRRGPAGSPSPSSGLQARSGGVRLRQGPLSTPFPAFSG